MNICDNLPCPICKKDAAAILKYAYTSRIRTKKHLVEFLRQFHNIVNMKLNKNTLNIEEVNNLYKDENFKEVCKEFFIIYQRKGFNIKLITHNFHKQRFLQSLMIKLDEIKPALILHDL